MPRPVLGFLLNVKLSPKKYKPGAYPSWLFCFFFAKILISWPVPRPKGLLLIKKAVFGLFSQQQHQKQQSLVFLPLFWDGLLMLLHIFFSVAIFWKEESVSWKRFLPLLFKIVFLGDKLLLPSTNFKVCVFNKFKKSPPTYFGKNLFWNLCQIQWRHGRRYPPVVTSLNLVAHFEKLYN